MRLVPANQAKLSEWDDFWEEKPGMPAWEGAWRRQPQSPDKILPEFEFEEGHERNRNDPPHRFLIGSWDHAHVRLADPRIPQRHVLLFKHGRNWFLERIDPNEAVYCNDRPLVVGKWHQLKSGDEFSLLRPPTPFTYRVEFDEESNWYLDLDREGNWQQNFDGEWYLRECPSLYPSKLQFPATPYPVAPEDLKRLAWQTDQMRRRSEEDQVRVGDWAAFARHVKAHYVWYGLEAQPFRGSVCEPREPPPPRPYRGLPDWIAEVVATERQVPGVSTPLSFEEALRLAGREAARPIEMRGPMSAPGTGTGGGARPSKGARLGKGTPLGQKGAPIGKGSGLPTGKGLRSQAGPVATAAVEPDLGAWLLDLDESGALSGYEAAIREKFGNVGGVRAVTVSSDGVLSKAFFEAVGVKKLGHKRTFEKFFREEAASRGS